MNIVSSAQSPTLHMGGVHIRLGVSLATYLFWGVLLAPAQKEAR